MPTQASEFTLARMTAAHLPEVAAIEKSVFPDPWPDAAFLEVLSFATTNWVALADGKVAGYLLTQWVLDEVHILNVAVSKDSQRHGVGRRLLAFLVDLTRKRGMRDLFLEVRVGNMPAIALYQGFGFEKVTVRKKYYSDGEDALIMHCHLADTAPDDSAAEQSELDSKR